MSSHTQIWDLTIEKLNGRWVGCGGGMRANADTALALNNRMWNVNAKINVQKNGQSPRVRPTDGSDESLKLEIARIQKPMSPVRWKQREL